jgi:hypothetical protein
MVFSVALMLSALVMSAFVLVNAYRRKQWPQTPGVIREADQIEDLDGGKYHLRYAYSVDGKEYISASTGHFLSRQRELTFIASTSVGAPVLVYHHPVHHGYSTLEPGIGQAETGICAALAVISVASGIYIAT